MQPLDPNEFWLYYAGLCVLALLLFIRHRPRRGMMLKFSRRDGGASRTPVATGLEAKIQALREQASPSLERPLNVFFNYNGHSWDAYEVLGLPAGSSSEAVERAYQEAMARVDAGSRPFIEAAFQAITGGTGRAALGS